MVEEPLRVDPMWRRFRGCPSCVALEPHLRACPVGRNVWWLDACRANPGLAGRVCERLTVSELKKSQLSLTSG
jgi:hypothetical protein